MKTLGSIESFTGGLFASTVISKSGASKYFKGSIVAYNNNIKDKLGINIKNGVMSKDVALEMASKARKFLDVDVCVAFTGNAGPSALEELKVGDVFIAINQDVYELHFDGDRNQVRKQAVDFAIKKLGNILLGE